MKYCSKCDSQKPLSDFNKDKSRKDGKMLYCKKCMVTINKEIRKRNNRQRTEYNKVYREKNRQNHNERERNYYNENKEKHVSKSKTWRSTLSGTYTTMHLAARARAKKKNIEYELTPETIMVLCEIQFNKCALTGLEFNLSKNGDYFNRPFAPSIDRKDSRKGYTFDNVQILCVVVNKAKNEYPQEIFDMMCISRVRKINGT